MERHNPVFSLPLVDSAEYVNDAHYYIEQNWLGRCAAYRHPPAYPYAIAILFKIFGNSVKVVKLFQILLDLLNTFFVYLIAKEVFNATAGLVASALYALYMPIIFYSIEILPPILAIFLLLASILSLIKSYQLQNTQASGKPWLSISGISFGLLLATIFNFIISLPLILLWQYRCFKGSIRRRLAYLSIFAAFSLAPVILTSARNCIFADDCAVVTSNGGSNFYIGNNQDIYKTVSLREGIGWVGLRLSPFQTVQIRNLRDLDLFFYKQGKEFVVHQPLKWLWVMLKKTVLFFNAYELPRNFDFYFFSNFSALARLPLVRFGLVLPLGLSAILYLMFMAANHKQRQLTSLILIILLSYCFSIIIFFVAGRYRLPIIPLFIILAAYYIVTFIGHYVNRQYRIVAAMVACACFFAALAQQKFFKDNYPYQLDLAHSYAQIARVFFMTHQPDAAYAFVQEGLKNKPDSSTYKLYSLLGLYYANTGERQKAIASLEKTLELKPENFFDYGSIAVLLASEGKPGQAIAYFKKGIEIAPYYPENYLGLAQLYSSRGDDNNAASALLSYHKTCVSMHPLIEYNLGKLYMDAFRDMQKAITHFGNAARYPQFLDNYEAECSDLYSRLGLCYRRLGESEKAKRTWLQGLKFFPRNNYLKNNLAMLQR